MSRIYNFAAGPSTLPLPALEEAARELVEYQNTGMSLIEMSHRGKIYDGIHNETIALVRELLCVPDDFHVLFLQGGATLQFGMVPMAFLHPGETAEHIITGHWAQRAYNDAALTGGASIIWDGGDARYTRIPRQDELHISRDAAYVHVCSNETIGGIQWPALPDTGDAPLVVDMSSDILSRPVCWDGLGMLFAGTQKNLAPAGMALVVLHRGFAERARKDLPAYLRYDLHIANNSMYNTPSTFVIWMTNLTLKWLKGMGGLPAIEKLRDEKAAMLYNCIDESRGYYASPVDPESRSKMNVVWRLADDVSEKTFLDGAEKEGLCGLKGHKSVGGCRASLYNAMPVEGVRALVQYMTFFMEKNG